MRGSDYLTVSRIYSLAGSPGVDNGEHTRHIVGLRWPTLCSISREDRGGTRGRLLTVKTIDSGSKDNFVASAARTQVNAALRQLSMPESSPTSATGFVLSCALSWGGTRGRLLTVKTIDSGSKDSSVSSAARTQVNAALRQVTNIRGRAWVLSKVMTGMAHEGDC